MQRLSLDESIQHYMTLRYDPSTPTFMPHKSWQDFLPVASDPDGKITEKKLRDEIWYQLHDADHVVIPLSSGVDSPLLLMLIRDIFPDIEITTLTHVGKYDESYEAKILSDKYNAWHFVVPQDDIIEAIPFMVKITGEPRWNAYQYQLYEYFYENIKSTVGKDKNIKWITGDGGDELFGGYVFRYSKFMNLKKSELLYLDYMQAHANDWVVDQHKLYKSPSTSCKSLSFYLLFRKYFDNPIHIVDQVMLADYNGKLLHDFLTTGRKMSQYYEIPTISPYMALHNYATHLPMEEKMTYPSDDTMTGKLHLRKIAERLGTKLSKEKVPYSLDIITDFKKHEDFFEKYLLDKNRNVYKYINYKWVDEHFGVDYDYGYVNKFLQLYCLDEWLKIMEGPTIA